ncbi:MAG: hypothetical protein ABI610_09100, partial [Acidobacteriota bacterium]
VVKYGKNLIERQHQQERLANVAIDLYASLAVLSRASATVRAKGAEGAEELRIARSFVQAVKYRVVGELKEMDKNRDRERSAERDTQRNRVAETAYETPGYRFDYWV